MKLSYNWLNEFVDLSGIDIAELSNILTMKTCEVEEYEPLLPHLDDIIVARVEKIEPHPDADKLRVTQVNTGSGMVQVVCGAPNVKEGGLYPLAPVGAVLPGDFKIKPAKLRGVESNGMLCSAKELALTDIILDNGEEGVDGLWTLTDDFEVGKPIRGQLFLDDFIIDIDNKSVTHRPDLWGHYGFARELASLLGRPLQKMPGATPFASDASVDQETPGPKTTIEADSAIAYSSATMTGVSVKPAHLKIQARLLAAGMRPINNIVDISNFIMLELGQPNHAFDRNFIHEDVSVSFSKAGEKLTLLDGKEATLPDGVVLIRDGKKPVALAGVMGGEGTEVADDTTTVFLESATFHRTHIRKTISALGVRTEASQRFEKGQDPLNTEPAIHRFAELLKESCPELRMGAARTVQKEEPRRNVIETSFTHLRNRLGGIELTEKNIVDLLESLGMKCEIDGDTLTVTTPTWRSYHDLTIPEDLVEELGRVIGYSEITPRPLMVSCEVPSEKNTSRELEHKLRGLLADAYHFSESYNYAFQSEVQIGMDFRFAKSAIKLKNSVNQELEFMRISPLPGLLKNIAENYKEYPRLQFFEIERIFPPREGQKEEGALPDERVFVAGAVVSDQKEEATLTSLSSILTDLLVRLGLSYENQGRLPLKEEIFHPGRGGVITNAATGKELIKWGELHPRLVKEAHIQRRVFYFEAFLDDLLELKQNAKPAYRPLVRFPASDFELTLLTDKNEPFENLLKAAGTPHPEKGAGEKTYLESVDHLTTYVGESVEAGKKAVSIRVCWRNATRTLEHDEIKKLQDDLIASVQKAGFVLR